MRTLNSLEQTNNVSLQTMLVNLVFQTMDN